MSDDDDIYCVPPSMGGQEERVMETNQTIARPTVADHIHAMNASRQTNVSGAPRPLTKPVVSARPSPPVKPKPGKPPPVAQKFKPVVTAPDCTSRDADVTAKRNEGDDLQEEQMAPAPPPPSIRKLPSSSLLPRLDHSQILLAKNTLRTSKPNDSSLKPSESSLNSNESSFLFDNLQVNEFVARDDSPVAHGNTKESEDIPPPVPSTPRPPKPAGFTTAPTSVNPTPPSIPSRPTNNPPTVPIPSRPTNLPTVPVPVVPDARSDSPPPLPATPRPMPAVPVSVRSESPPPLPATPRPSKITSASSNIQSSAMDTTSSGDSVDIPELNSASVAMFLNRQLPPLPNTPITESKVDLPPPVVGRTTVAQPTSSDVSSLQQKPPPIPDRSLPAIPQQPTIPSGPVMPPFPCPKTDSKIASVPSVPSVPCAPKRELPTPSADYEMEESDDSGLNLVPPQINMRKSRDTVNSEHSANVNKYLSSQTMVIMVQKTGELIEHGGRVFRVMRLVDDFTVSAPKKPDRPEYIALDLNETLSPRISEYESDEERVDAGPRTRDMNRFNKSQTAPSTFTTDFDADEDYMAPDDIMNYSNQPRVESGIEEDLYEDQDIDIDPHYTERKMLNERWKQDQQKTESKDAAMVYTNNECAREDAAKAEAELEEDRKRKEKEEKKKEKDDLRKEKEIKKEEKRKEEYQKFLLSLKLDEESVNIILHSKIAVIKSSSAFRFTNLQFSVKQGELVDVLRIDGDRALVKKMDGKLGYVEKKLLNVPEPEPLKDIRPAPVILPSGNSRPVLPPLSSMPQNYMDMGGGDMEDMYDVATVDEDFYEEFDGPIS